MRGLHQLSRAGLIVKPAIHYLNYFTSLLQNKLIHQLISFFYIRFLSTQPNLYFFRLTDLAHMIQEEGVCILNVHHDQIVSKLWCLMDFFTWFSLLHCNFEEKHNVWFWYEKQTNKQFILQREFDCYHSNPELFRCLNSHNHCPLSTRFDNEITNCIEIMNCTHFCCIHLVAYKWLPLLMKLYSLAALDSPISIFKLGKAFCDKCFN